MKKIIIMTDRADTLTPYTDMLGKLFPDCEIRTTPRKNADFTAQNIIRKNMSANGEYEY